MITEPKPAPAALFAALLGLCSLGVAQPLLEVLTASPEFFVIRDLQVPAIVLLVLAVTLVPPAALFLLWILARSLRARLTMSAQIVGLTLAGIPPVLLVAKELGLSAAVFSLPLATICGFLIAVGFSYNTTIRQVLSFTCLAAVAVSALFFLNPGMRSVFNPEEIDVGGENLFSIGNPSPVFLIIFDEFSSASLMNTDLSINRTRYPNIARLADTATWYPRATTVSEATNYAVPAILTGNLPEKGRLPNLAGHPQNIFTLLANHYSVFSYEPITRLCPPEINLLKMAEESSTAVVLTLIKDLGLVYFHIVLPDDLVTRLPPVTLTWGGFNGDPGDQRSFGKAPSAETTMADFNVHRADHTKQKVVSGFETFLAQIRESDSCLYSFHLMLPHTPWRYLPGGALYRPPFGEIHGLEAKMWSDDPWFPRLAMQRYLLQLEYTDRVVGNFIDRLVDLEIFDRALIVLVADHGVGFRAGDSQRFLTDTNAGEIVPVPLLI